MNKFPVIETFNEYKRYIEDSKIISVLDKDDYLVVTYNVLDYSEFTGENSEYKREARGITFAKNGRVISRPFHKFFNLFEIEETQPHNLDFSKEHYVLEKLDGSMIHPLYFGDYFRLATKRGITDISLAAEKYLASLDKVYYDWITNLLKKDYTPIFEYISPNNRIVVEYEQEDLVLLAVRNMFTGEYVDIENIDTPFRKVKNYGSLDYDLNEFVEKMHEAEGEEGVVIRFNDGEMIKVKTQWYVNIHKVLEYIHNDFRVAEIYIDDRVDDVLPFLDEYHKNLLFKKISMIESCVDELYNCVMNELCYIKSNNMSRKDYALENRDRYLKSFVFKVFEKEFDRNVAYQMFKDVVKKGKNNFNRFMDWCKNK